jgi:hypothetical protein
VRFAPGWLRDATRPSLTGSMLLKKTIGIVDVAAFAAWADTTSVATMTDTWRSTRLSIRGTA